MNLNEEETKKFFQEMLKKNGTDVDKWRDDFNSFPSSQRQMVCTFDTGVKDGIIFKFTYIATAVEIIINDKEARKAIEEGTME